MSLADWSLLTLLSSSIEQCESIEFLPLTSNDDYQVFCYCEENRYLCINSQEIRSIVTLCYSTMSTSDQQQLNIVTRVLLSCVTECLTSWNIRRRLVLSGVIHVDEELKYLEKILSLRPKSEQMFRYRRWLIKQVDKKEISIDHEFSVCDKTAEKHFINYASWQYRRWLIDYFQLNINDELNRHSIWFEKNLSDSSSFSYRIFLLSKSSNETQSIERELMKNEEKLRFFNDRESLWIYRRTLIFLAWKLFHFDRTKLFERELDFVENFKKNIFTEKYICLLKTLIFSQGQFYRQ